MERSILPLRFILITIFLLSYLFSLRVLVYNPNNYDLINYQVKIYVGNSSGVFLDENMAVPAVYCFEQDNGECNLTPSEWAWVKTNISKGSFITLYIGNGNYAVNGDQVFDFYDDFNEGVIDTNKWEIINSDDVDPACIDYSEKYYEIVNGTLHIHSYVFRDSLWCGYEFKSKKSLNWTNYEIYGKVRWENFDYYRGGGDALAFFVYDSENNISKISLNMRGDYKVYSYLTCDGVSSGLNLADYSSGLWISRYIVKEDSILMNITGTYNIFKECTSVSLPRPLRISLKTWPGRWTSSSVSIDAYYDFIRVRKLADIEPMVIYKKVEICNPNSGDLNDFQVEIEGENFPSDLILIDKDLNKYYSCLEQENGECVGKISILVKSWQEVQNCSLTPVYKYLYVSDSEDQDGGIQDSNGNYWYEPDFNDTNWSLGHSPFGGSGSYCTYVLDNTPDDLFVRKWFFVPSYAKKIKLYLAYDDGIRCYINGQLIVDRLNEAHGAIYWNLIVDITNYVNKGEENLLACWVANGGENSGSGRGYFDAKVEYTTSSTNKIWAKINISANSCKDFYIITWNESGIKNGDEIFEFYDDFNEPDLNHEKWPKVKEENTGHYEITGENGTSYLKVWDDSAHCGVTYVELISRNLSMDSAVVVFKMKILQERLGNPSFGVLNGTDWWTALNSCAGNDWWNIYINDSFVFNCDHRTAYKQDWGEIIMKLNATYQKVELVSENYSVEKKDIYKPFSVISVFINGGTCCGAPHHIFGYDYVFVRKFAPNDPQITLFDYLPSLTVTPENQSWTNQITINISCLDCSGIYYKIINYSQDCDYSNYNFVSSNFTQVEITNSGEWKLCVIVRGELGENSSIYSFGPYQLDKNPPVSTIFPQGGTYYPGQSFSISCQDDLSGCNSSYYTVIQAEDSCPTNTSDYSLYSNPVVLEDGYWKVCYFSIDNAGNFEEIKYSIYNITGAPGAIYSLPPLAKIKSKFKAQNLTLVVPVKHYNNTFGLFAGNITVIFTNGKVLLLNCSKNCTVMKSLDYNFKEGVVFFSVDETIKLRVGSRVLINYEHNAATPVNFGILCDNCKIGLVGFLGKKA